MEEWCDINGFIGLYKVSNKGRVKNVSTGKVLKNIRNRQKYCLVNLYRDKKMYQKFVHRLVAEAFIPNINNFPFVGHWDDDPENNCVENLYWTTTKENNNHGKHNERLSASLLNRKDTSKPVLDYVDGVLVAEYKSQSEASRATGIGQGNISACCSNKFKQINGHVFKFRD